MSADSPQAPQTTREFVALWNDTVEDHLVRQVAQLLPALARDIDATAMARPLVRALRLSAVSGDVAAAVRYLADAARDQGGAPSPNSRG